MSKSVVVGIAAIIGFLAINSVVWGDGAAASSPGDRIAIGAPARGTRAGFVLEAGTWIRQLIRPGTGPGRLALILAAALAYGVLHALGPGHQKSLLAGSERYGSASPASISGSRFAKA